MVTFHQVCTVYSLTCRVIWEMTFAGFNGPELPDNSQYLYTLYRGCLCHYRGPLQTYVSTMSIHIVSTRHTAEEHQLQQTTGNLCLIQREQTFSIVDYKTLSRFLSEPLPNVTAYLYMTTLLLVTAGIDPMRKPALTYCRYVKIKLCVSTSITK